MKSRAAIVGQVFLFLLCQATLRAESKEFLCGSDEMRLHLEEMRKTDQSFRTQNGVNHDSANIAELRKVIKSCGWPLLSIYGRDAVSGAFLVLQHAPLDDQLKYVDLLREADRRAELPRGSLPLLEDRILVRQGKPQIYGSQIKGSGVPYPIDDEPNLDRRRESVGLGPYKDYLEYLKP